MLASLLFVARGELGQGETPPGSNITKYGAWYPMNGAAWCAMFVSWCAHVAGIPTSIIPKHAYTPTGAKWFYDRNRWGTTPKRGAIVYFAFYGPTYQNRWKGICHVGIVESVEADGSIITIEGNVGNKVQRLRRRANIAGYGYPDYGVPDPYPTLRRGDNGEAVKRMQLRLIVHGHRLPLFGADGNFGAETEGALKAFQFKRGMDITGICDDKVWVALVQEPQSSVKEDEMHPSIRMTVRPEKLEAFKKELLPVLTKHGVYADLLDKNASGQPVVKPLNPPTLRTK